MKRGLIIVLAILFLLPAATATLVINGPQIDKFNIGDPILISGYTKHDSSMTGFLKFSMECETGTYPLQMVPVSLIKNQQLTFPGDIKLPTLVASSSIQGTCRIRADLTTGDTLLDWAESDPFEITNSLEGTFEIEEPRVQIGSELKITGEITRLDNTKIDGSAEVYFKKDDTSYLVAILDVKEGILEYTHTMPALQEGRYFLEIRARDTFGNEEFFTDAASFVLIKELSVIAKLDNDEYLPGDTVTIHGEVRTALQEQVKSASVVISIGLKSYTTQMTDGTFRGSFQIPHNIESGRHTVVIAVKDNAGNVGLAKIGLYIEAIPSAISIRLNNKEFIPGDMLEVTGTLYDQASDVINQDLFLEIYNQNGKLATSKSIQSAKKEIFSLPEFSVPGEWTIIVTYDELERKETITLKKHVNLGVQLENTILTIKNLGNVKFKDTIEIQAVGDGESYTVSRKETINENDTAIIDLSKQLPTGMYAINVNTPLGEETFTDLNILDGKSWLSFNFVYLLMVMVCISLLSYIAYSKISPKRKNNTEHMPFKIKQVNTSPEKQKFSIYNIGKDKAGEMADYKARILRDVKQAEETEAKRIQRQNFNRAMNQREDPKEDTVFSMFD
ncbi:MAG: hypothetical protein V1914_03055 [archaeon]